MQYLLLLFDCGEMYCGIIDLLYFEQVLRCLGNLHIHIIPSLLCCAFCLNLVIAECLYH